MIPATSASLPICNPGHPLYHKDCPCCREHYDKPISAPANTPPEEAVGKIMSRIYRSRRVPRLRELREAQHITQERLAKISGISARQIINLEEGRNRARGITATKLAEALCVEVEDLEGTS